jgi:hypothetical protein
MRDSGDLASTPKKRLFRALVRLSNALFGRDLTHRSRLAGALLRGVDALVGLISPARRRQRRFEQANPEAPWFAPASLPVIDDLLEPGFQGFEWGTGRSTLWFAERVAHLTSVESDADWADRVRRWLDEMTPSGKVDLRLIAIPVRHDFTTDQVAGYLAPISEFSDHHFDFIVVDGLFRRECLGAARPKLKPGGYLIVDNADLPEIAEALASLSGCRVGVFSNGIWETAIYRAPVPGGLPNPDDRGASLQRSGSAEPKFE